MRHARINVNHELRVLVVIPMRYSQAELQILLAEKRKWIEKQLAFFSKGRESFIELIPGEILFLGKAIRPHIPITNKAELEEWYREEARKYITERLEVFAFQYGFTYNRVFIRGSKTKWGTCSRKKNLGFNWRLIKAPEAIIDYVILHELTHTLVFDHSKKFWNTLERFYPDHKAAKKWLKDFGAALY